jgi:ketosteroid isomerase-like protein
VAALMTVRLIAIAAAALLAAPLSHGTARSERDAAAMVRTLTASAEDWNRGDLDRFIAPYAAESTFMTPAGPVGRAAMVERYRGKYFASGRPQQTLRFDGLEVRTLGSDHALMTGRFLLAGGGLADQSGRFTLIWVRQADGWRILHDHTS